MLRKARVWVVVALAVAAAARAGAPARATEQAGRWCRARSSSTWQHVLSHHVVPLSRTTPLHPLAIGNGGRSFFAEIFTKDFTGVAEIAARSAAVTRIKAFPDSTPATGAEDGDQAWGSFDGRWLVWKEFRGETDFNRFTVWAWDSRTGRRFRIGAATRAPSGQFWPSPWQGAEIRNGIAIWVQGVGPDHRAEVHAYDLRTRRDRVVRTGHPANAFLLRRRIVVWLEAPARGAATRIRAASALTGARVPVPVSLRNARNSFGLATDGQRIAYPDAAYQSLWWSASPAQKPHEIVGTGNVDHIDNSVQIGGRYLGFGIQPRVFVADARAHRYVEVGRTGGSTLLDRNSLLVVYGNRSKFDPIVRIALVAQADLPPVPTCR